jgi:transcriptional regulator with XRE-family HTH domain
VTDRQDDLAATLRVWRDRLSPASVGLPVGRVRRASGLRREELADLAGISVDYIVRLEQGRATTPSAQVLGSLARALRLTTGERDHLFRLAGQIPPADNVVSDHIPPGVQRVVSRLGDAAVAVFAADWRLIWWNKPWAAVIGDPSPIAPARRNFALDSFSEDSTDLHLSRWPVTTIDGSEGLKAAVVSDLRLATGRFPGDVRLRTLIRLLETESPEFAELWSHGAVGAHREAHKVIHHPSVGPITVDCDVLTDGDAHLKIVVMTAAPDSEDETKLRLASVTIPQDGPVDYVPSMASDSSSR